MSNRPSLLVTLCIAAITAAGTNVSSVRAASASVGVEAVTIAIDKDANVTLNIPGIATPRVFRGAEFLNILASTPSITPQTRITLSPDRDVPDGIISLIKESLYMKGQKPIEVVFSNSGDEIVLVVVTNSSECEIVAAHVGNKIKVACVELMSLLKRQFIDTARTNVSILPLDGVTDDYIAQLGNEISAAGFKYGGAGRMGFISEPENGNR